MSNSKFFSIAASTRRTIVFGSGLPILIVLLLAACSQSGGDKQQADAFLPGTAADGLVRSEQVRVFKGLKLSEYLADGAEIYLKHDFVQLVTAQYSGDGIEVTADVFQFRSAQNALELYNTIRPPDSAPAPLGHDGHTDPGRIVFIKDRYLVRISGEDDSQATIDAIMAVASAIDDAL